MHDVFISYAHEDKGRVRTLVSAFEREGWSVWWDDRIEIGIKYAPVLDAALDDSRVVVACWSHEALHSDYVRYETRVAEARHVLVQVRFEDVDVPPLFDAYNICDLSDWQGQTSHGELDRLLHDISGRLTLAKSGFPVDISGAVPGFLGRPATAVLPFRNETDDADMDYVLDSLAEETMQRLQRFRSLPIISSNSSMRFRDATNLERVAMDLGARYVITGRLRRVSGHDQLRVELLQAPHETIWSTDVAIDGFERSSLQDELSLNLAAEISPEIERSVCREALPIQRERAQAWHLVRQGIWQQSQLTREGATRARELFEEALGRDEANTEARIQLAWWHFWDISRRRGDPDEWRRPEELAQQALVGDPRDARPLTLIGISHMMRGHHEEARRHYREAMERNPSYAWAYAHMGSCLYLDGQPRDSLVFTKKAIRLSPMDLFVFHAYCDIATSNYMLGDYESALQAAQVSLRYRAGYWLAHVLRICSLVRLDDLRAAERALERMVSTKPHISRRDIDWIMFSDRAWNEQLAGDLARSGWQGVESA